VTNEPRQTAWHAQARLACDAWPALVFLGAGAPLKSNDNSELINDLAPVPAECSERRRRPRKTDCPTMDATAPPAGPEEHTSRDGHTKCSQAIR
jgi:hypothetical protein